MEETLGRAVVELEAAERDGFQELGIICVQGLLQPTEQEGAEVEV